jgi:FAD/FMN-containing dehydrogenase
MLRKQFLKMMTLTAAGQWLAMQNAFSSNWLDPFVSNKDVRYVKSGESGYDQLRQGFNKRIQKYPAVVAECLNESGVQQAIQLARRLNLPVSVQSGGHCMEGFSASEGGMMLVLKSMNRISWVDTSTIRVEPACTLAALYDELLPKKKYLPGGSCAGVAIAGLTLGGGYGLLSRKFGLTCDSLRAVSMVDGRGNRVDSSKDPELLKACRGGNNGNFGVVTSLTFQLHQAPPTMRQYKFRSFQVTPERAKSLMRSWFECSKKLPDDCFSAFVLNRKTVYVLLTQTGAKHPMTERFILEMGSRCDKKTQTAPQPLAQALRNYYGRTEPLYFKNASAGLYHAFSDLEGVVDAMIRKVADSPGLIFQVNTLGGKVMDEQAERQSVFPHRRFAFFSELQAYWDQPGQAKSRVAAFQTIQRLIDDGKQRPQYRNYPDIDFSNPLQQYYGDRLSWLTDIKKRMDPDNTFRYEQSLKTS